MTEWQAASLVALGAVVFLDQWPAVQSMVSRPIVVGPAVGWILGAPADGVLWGASFETMVLAIQPVGAARYPDAALAGLLGTTAAIVGMDSEIYPAAWAVAVAGGAGWAGEVLGRLQRRWNARTAAAVRARVAGGSLAAPARGIAVALSRGAALGALQAAGGLVIVIAGTRLLAGSPWTGRLDAHGLRIAAAAMAGVAGARALGIGRKRLASLALGAATGVALVALGVAQ
ncbi:MAG TPA: PTS sugar transporter subunit IIC [Gemmatimonadota bacterium]|jgi:mannose/fructose/N-acetylgalactosamine-specific phosphotransferase system component IIC|nr:PTS sugar transporter subunit IIC [Gemmatimonadota bacterium]